MADYYTDMSTLMTAIKKRLLTYQTSTLHDIKTWKRGILPPLPRFPALAIIPLRETLVSPRSGGVYRNDRDLNIEIYTKSMKNEISLRDNMEIIEAVKDALKTEYQLDYLDTKATYDLVMQPHQFGEDIPFRNAMVQKCIIPVRCKSLESVPTNPTFTTKIHDTTPNALLDEIFDRLRRYDGFTKTIKTIKKGTLPPCMGYPSVHVLEDTDTKERYEAGIDRPTRSFTIAVFNKQLDKEVLLDDMITVMEETKNFLQQNSRFGNLCRNSWVSSVDYGTYPVEKGALYGAFITLLTWGWDPVS